ncbi:MAG: S8 family serine peptidase [Candidatus Thermoplasmatota archaeon]|nr:S8 family serine peptidase [Candidatus Thermoplasmatota archaeon]
MQKRIIVLVAAIAFSMIFAPLAVPTASALDKSVDTIHARGLWTAEWVDVQGNVHQGVTGKGVRAAVVDTGIDGTHPDLDDTHVVYNAKNAAVTWIETQNTDTTCGHGTHCAGIIGATGEKSDGKYKGVALGCDLIGLGCGDVDRVPFATEGLNWVNSNADSYNIKIVSCSWGASGTVDTSPVYQQLYEKGVVVVFAAGNDGGDGSSDMTGSESKNPYVISVAACQKSGSSMADFSSRGSKSDSSTWPDITAPGVGIWSCAATTGIYMNVFSGVILPVVNGYVQSDGTSMACPHVSGVVALMFEVNPNLTPAQVMEIINKTADQNFGTYADSGFAAGHGLINATKAVAAAHYMLLHPSASVDTAANSSRVGEKDGHLVLNPGVIYAQNAPPQASFTYSPSSATTATTIQFTDSSVDSDGTIVSWNWNFGDGTTSTAKNPTHKFSAAGDYTVRLAVQDNEGAKGYCNKTITVSAVTGAKVPSKITGLTASVSDHSMQLAWNVPSDNGKAILNYKIYRAVDSSDARTVLGTSDKNSYSDTNISAGKTYYYWVSAVNSDGEGALSAYTWVSIPQDYQFEEKQKSFIPGFEIAVLATAIALASIVAYKKRR